MKKEILFIINPIAGIRKKINFSETILNNVDVTKYDYEIKYTETAGHATQLAADAVHKKFDFCFAVGGDGTVNEVAKSLRNSETCLAIIPCGSGNGLARHLKIPLQVNKAIRLISKGKILRMDSMMVNDHFSINVSGIGFDAHVAAKFGKAGKRGFWNYTRQVINEYKKYPEQKFLITCDGENSEHSLILIAFANSSQFGNNAYIAPHASVVDEMLDIVLVRKIPFIKAVTLVPKLFNKTFDESGFVEIIRAKSCVIQSENPVALHIDGEPCDLVSLINLQIKPASLNVLVPEITYG